MAEDEELDAVALGLAAAFQGTTKETPEASASSLQTSRDDDCEGLAHALVDAVLTRGIAGVSQNALGALGALLDRAASTQLETQVISDLVKTVQRIAEGAGTILSRDAEKLARASVAFLIAVLESESQTIHAVKGITKSLQCITGQIEMGSFVDTRVASSSAAWPQVLDEACLGLNKSELTNTNEEGVNAETKSLHNTVTESTGHVASLHAQCKVAFIAGGISACLFTVQRLLHLGDVCAEHISVTLSLLTLCVPEKDDTGHDMFDTSQGRELSPQDHSRIEEVVPYLLPYFGETGFQVQGLAAQALSKLVKLLPFPESRVRTAITIAEHTLTTPLPSLALGDANELSVLKCRLECLLCIAAALSRVGEGEFSKKLQALDDWPLAICKTLVPLEERSRSETTTQLKEQVDTCLNYSCAILAQVYTSPKWKSVLKTTSGMEQVLVLVTCGSLGSRNPALLAALHSFLTETQEWEVLRSITQLQPGKPISLQIAPMCLQFVLALQYGRQSALRVTTRGQKEDLMFVQVARSIISSLGSAKDDSSIDDLYIIICKMAFSTCGDAARRELFYCALDFLDQIEPNDGCTAAYALVVLIDLMLDGWVFEALREPIHESENGLLKLLASKESITRALACPPPSQRTVKFTFDDDLGEKLKILSNFVSSATGRMYTTSKEESVASSMYMHACLRVLTSLLGAGMVDPANLGPALHPGVLLASLHISLMPAIELIIESKTKSSSGAKWLPFPKAKEQSQSHAMERVLETFDSIMCLSSDPEQHLTAALADTSSRLLAIIGELYEWPSQLLQFAAKFTSHFLTVRIEQLRQLVAASIWDEIQVNNKSTGGKKTPKSTSKPSEKKKETFVALFSNEILQMKCGTALLGVLSGAESDDIEQLVFEQVQVITGPELKAQLDNLRLELHQDRKPSRSIKDISDGIFNEGLVREVTRHGSAIDVTTRSVSLLLELSQVLKAAMMRNDTTDIPDFAAAAGSLFTFPFWSSLSEGSSFLSTDSAFAENEAADESRRLMLLATTAKLIREPVDQASQQLCDDVFHGMIQQNIDINTMPVRRHVVESLINAYSAVLAAPTSTWQTRALSLNHLGFLLENAPSEWNLTSHLISEICELLLLDIMQGHRNGAMELHKRIIHAIIFRERAGNTPILGKALTSFTLRTILDSSRAYTNFLFELSDSKSGTLYDAQLLVHVCCEVLNMIASPTETATKMDISKIELADTCLKLLGRLLPSASVADAKSLSSTAVVEAQLALSGTGNQVTPSGQTSDERPRVASFEEDTGSRDESSDKAKGLGENTDLEEEEETNGEDDESNNEDGEAEAGHGSDNGDSHGFSFEDSRRALRSNSKTSSDDNDDDDDDDDDDENQDDEEAERDKKRTNAAENEDEMDVDVDVDVENYTNDQGNKKDDEEDDGDRAMDEGEDDNSSDRPRKSRSHSRSRVLKMYTRGNISLQDLHQISDNRAQTVFGQQDLGDGPFLGNSFFGNVSRLGEQIHRQRRGQNSHTKSRDHIRRRSSSDRQSFDALRKQGSGERRRMSFGVGPSKSKANDGMLFKSASRFMASSPVPHQNAQNQSSRGALKRKSLAKAICSYTVTGDNYEDQHWYHCITCDLVKERGCCSVCARRCHKGHQITYSRRSRFFCDCGAGKKCTAKKPLTALEDNAFNRMNLVGFKESPRQKDTLESCAPSFHWLSTSKDIELAKNVLGLYGEKNFVQVMKAVLGWLFEVKEAQKEHMVPPEAYFFERSRTLSGAYQVKGKPRKSNDAAQGNAALNTAPGTKLGKSSQHTFGTNRKLLAASSRGHLFLAEGPTIRCMHAGALLCEGACNLQGTSYFSSGTSVPGNAMAPLYRMSLSFNVHQMEFNPLCDSLLAIVGECNCFVLTLLEKGAVQCKFRIELGIGLVPQHSSDEQLSTSVLGVAWLESSQTQLLVVSNQWAKVFDIASSTIYPLHYIELDSQIVTFTTSSIRNLSHAETKVLLALESGEIVSHTIDASLRKVSPKVVIELPFPIEASIVSLHIPKGTVRNSILASYEGKGVLRMCMDDVFEQALSAEWIKWRNEFQEKGASLKQSAVAQWFNWSQSGCPADPYLTLGLSEDGEHLFVAQDNAKSHQIEPLCAQDLSWSVPMSKPISDSPTWLPHSASLASTPGRGTKRTVAAICVWPPEWSAKPNYENLRDHQGSYFKSPPQIASLLNQMELRGARGEDTTFGPAGLNAGPNPELPVVDLENKSLLVLFENGQLAHFKPGATMQKWAVQRKTVMDAATGTKPDAPYNSIPSSFFFENVIAVSSSELLSRCFSLGGSVRQCGKITQRGIEALQNSRVGLASKSTSENLVISAQLTCPGYVLVAVRVMLSDRSDMKQPVFALVGPFNRMVEVDPGTAQWIDLPLTPLEVLLSASTGAIRIELVTNRRENKGTAERSATQSPRSSGQGSGIVVDSIEAYAMSTRSSIWLAFMRSAWKFGRDVLACSSPAKSDMLHEGSDLFAYSRRVASQAADILAFLVSKNTQLLDTVTEDPKLPVGDLQELVCSELLFGSIHGKLSISTPFSEMLRSMHSSDTSEFSRDVLRTCLSKLEAIVTKDQAVWWSLPQINMLLSFLDRIRGKTELFSSWMNLSRMNLIGHTLASSMRVEAQSFINRNVSVSPDVLLWLHKTVTLFVGVILTWCYANWSMGEKEKSLHVVRSILVTLLQDGSYVLHTFVTQALGYFGVTLTMLGRYRGKAQAQTKSLDLETKSQGIEYRCDGCEKMPLEGVRWHCTVCDDFDLCGDCKGKEFDQHLPSHAMDPILLEADKSLRQDTNKIECAEMLAKHLFEYTQLPDSDPATSMTFMKSLCEIAKRRPEPIATLVADSIATSVEVELSANTGAPSSENLLRLRTGYPLALQMSSLRAIGLIKSSPFARNKGESKPAEHKKSAPGRAIPASETRNSAASNSRNALKSILSDDLATNLSVKLLDLISKLSRLAPETFLSDKALVGTEGINELFSTARGNASVQLPPFGDANFIQSRISSFSIGTWNASSIVFWSPLYKSTTLITCLGALSTQVIEKWMARTLLKSACELAQLVTIQSVDLPHRDAIVQALLFVVQQPHFAFVHRKANDLLGTICQSKNAQWLRSVDTFTTTFEQIDKIHEKLRVTAMGQCIPGPDQRGVMPSFFPPELTYQDFVVTSSNIQKLLHTAIGFQSEWQRFCSDPGHHIVALIRMLGVMPSRCALDICQLVFCGLPPVVSKSDTPESQDQALVRSLSSAILEDDSILVKQLSYNMFLVSLEPNTRILSASIWRRVWALLSRNAESSKLSEEISRARKTMLTQLFSSFARSSETRQYSPEFLSLLTALISNGEFAPEKGDTDTGFWEPFIQQLVALLKWSVSLSANSPGALHSRQVAKFVRYHLVDDQAQDLKGVVLPSSTEPVNWSCLTCKVGDRSAKMTNLKHARSEVKFTANTMLVGLNCLYTIDAIGVDITTQSNSTFGSGVTAINVFCNSSPSSELNTLVNRWSSWHKIGSLQVSRERDRKAKLVLPVPVSACNLMFEYETTSELAFSQSSERQICPRCNRTVTERSGVCQCGEVVFQCRQCRRINQEDRNAFLCVECGFCRFAKFSYSFEAEVSTEYPPVLTESDREHALRDFQTFEDTAQTLEETVRSSQMETESQAAKLWRHLGSSALSQQFSSSTEASAEGPARKRSKSRSSVSFMNEAETLGNRHRSRSGSGHDRSLLSPHSRATRPSVNLPGATRKLDAKAQAAVQRLILSSDSVATIEALVGRSEVSGAPESASTEHSALKRKRPRGSLKSRLPSWGTGSGSSTPSFLQRLLSLHDSSDTKPEDRSQESQNESANQRDGEGLNGSISKRKSTVGNQRRRVEKSFKSAELVDRAGLLDLISQLLDAPTESSDYDKLVVTRKAINSIHQQLVAYSCQIANSVLTPSEAEAQTKQDRTGDASNLAVCCAQSKCSTCAEELSVVTVNLISAMTKFKPLTALLSTALPEMAQLLFRRGPSVLSDGSLDDTGCALLAIAAIDAHPVLELAQRQVLIALEAPETMHSGGWMSGAWAVITRLAETGNPAGLNALLSVLEQALHTEKYQSVITKAEVVEGVFMPALKSLSSIAENEKGGCMLARRFLTSLVYLPYNTSQTPRGGVRAARAIQRIFRARSKKTGHIHVAARKDAVKSCPVPGLAWILTLLMEARTITLNEAVSAVLKRIFTFFALPPSQTAGETEDATKKRRHSKKTKGRKRGQKHKSKATHSGSIPPSVSSKGLNLLDGLDGLYLTLTEMYARKSTNAMGVSTIIKLLSTAVPIIGGTAIEHLALQGMASFLTKVIHEESSRLTAIETIKVGQVREDGTILPDWAPLDEDGESFWLVECTSALTGLCSQSSAVCRKLSRQSQQSILESYLRINTLQTFQSSAAISACEMMMEVVGKVSGFEVASEKGDHPQGNSLGDSIGSAQEECLRICGKVLLDLSEELDGVNTPEVRLSVLQRINKLVEDVSNMINPTEVRPNIFLHLHRARSQEEYFSGNLETNPMSIDDIPPDEGRAQSQSDQDGPAGSNDPSSSAGLSNVEPGGGRVRSFSEATGQPLAPAQSDAAVGDEEKEPTMRDLRAKIATDLNFHHAKDIIELLVAGKIVGLDLPIRLVYEKLWKPYHLKEEGGAKSNQDDSDNDEGEDEDEDDGDEDDNDGDDDEDGGDEDEDEDEGDEDDDDDEEDGNERNGDESVVNEASSSIAGGVSAEEGNTSQLSKKRSNSDPDDDGDEEMDEVSRREEADLAEALFQRRNSGALQGGQTVLAIGDDGAVMHVAVDGSHFPDSDEMSNIDDDFGNQHRDEFNFGRQMLFHFNGEGAMDEMDGVNRNDDKFPPMDVTYRLQGLDGEATEDFVETLSNDNGEGEETEQEVHIRLLRSKTFATEGLVALLGLVRHFTKLNIGSSFVRQVFGATLSLLNLCSNSPEVRSTLHKLDAVPLLLSALMASFREVGAARQAEILVLLLEQLVVDVSSPGSNPVDSDLKAGEAPSSPSTSQLSVFLEQLDAKDQDHGKALQNSPRLLRAMARLLPFLTYGQSSEMMRLINRFETHLGPDQLAELDEGDSEKVDAEKQFQLDCILWSIDAMQSDQNSIALRSAAIQHGFTLSLVGFFVDSRRKYLSQAPSTNSEVISSSGSKSLEGRKQFASLPSSAIVLRMLSGLCRGHPETQQMLMDRGVLKIALELEQISMGDVPLIGDLADSLLRAAAEDNKSVDTYIKDLRSAEIEKKRKKALARRENMLSKLGLDENNTNKRKRRKSSEQVDAEGADSEVLKKNKKKNKKKHGTKDKKSKKTKLLANTKVLQGSAPSWMEEMENLEDEKGFVCTVCQEGFTYKPDEPMGIYVFNKMVPISTGVRYVTRSKTVFPSLLSPSEANKDEETAKLHRGKDEICISTDFENQLKTVAPNVYILWKQSTPRKKDFSVSGTEVSADECGSSDWVSQFTLKNSRGSSATLSQRKVLTPSSVSSFNSIHFSCHQEAAKADKQHPKAPKEEWEGASLRNGQTKCNNLLPLRGPPTVPMPKYDTAMTRYFEVLKSRSRGVADTGPGAAPSATFTLLLDLRSLLLRIAFGESLSEDTAGGGLESNLKLIVPLLSASVGLLESSPEESAFISDILDAFYTETILDVEWDRNSSEPGNVSISEPKTSSRSNTPNSGGGKRKRERSPSRLPVLESGSNASDCIMAAILSLFCGSKSTWTALRPIFLRGAIEFTLRTELAFESGDETALSSGAVKNLNKAKPSSNRRKEMALPDRCKPALTILAIVNELHNTIGDQSLGRWVADETNATSSIQQLYSKFDSSIAPASTLEEMLRNAGCDPEKYLSFFLDHSKVLENTKTKPSRRTSVSMGQGEAST